MRTYARLFSAFATSLLAVAGIAIVAPSAAQAAETRVVCNHDWVRVRASASTGSAELGRLTRGTAVTGDRQGSWFRLTDGRYVAAYYTCLGGGQPAPAASSPTATHQVCRTPWVRVRAAATTRSAEIGRLTQGTVFAGRRTGSWIKLDRGGHVAASYACAAPANATAPAPTPAPPARIDGTPLLQPTGTLGSPTSPFGRRFHPILRVWHQHNGIDLGNRAGEPVHAAEAGVVTTVSRDASSGLYIKIDHGTVAGTPRVGTGYLHLQSAAVSPGQRVERGQLIARVGTTGLSTKPHLHFITYESGRPVNPEKYIGPLDSLRA